VDNQVGHDLSALGLLWVAALLSLATTISIIDSDTPTLERRRLRSIGTVTGKVAQQLPKTGITLAAAEYLTLSHKGCRFKRLVNAPGMRQTG
jgi:hypothetical protein